MRRQIDFQDSDFLWKHIFSSYKPACFTALGIIIIIFFFTKLKRTGTVNMQHFHTLLATCDATKLRHKKRNHGETQIRLSHMSIYHCSITDYRKGLDQTVHKCSLIWAFVVCILTLDMAFFVVKVLIFFLFLHKITLWILITSTSLRPFYRVPKAHFFREGIRKIFRPMLLSSGRSVYICPDDAFSDNTHISKYSPKCINIYHISP